MAAPFDVPGKPGTPQALDWGRDYCVITFTPPLSDGGSPITSYIVEYKYKGMSDWEEVINRAQTNKVKISDLVEGSQIEFRVKAVNKAGEGEPSDPSKLITIKPR